MDASDYDVTYVRALTLLCHGKGKNMTKSKKAGMITAIVIIAVIFCVLTFGLVFKLMHYDFFSGAESSSQIPGLSDGLVQQGYDYVESEAAYLTSGYMRDGSASRIYITKGGETYYKPLYYIDADGNKKEYNAHAGGISHFGNYVYIADEEDFTAGKKQNTADIAVFSLSDIIDKEKEAVCIGTIPMPYAPSFCTVYGDMLYVGRFAKEGHAKYGRLDEHAVTVGDETNSSLILAYRLDNAKTDTFGVDITAPVRALSIGDLVQGMCFAGDGRTILSTSWSVNSSHLYFYTVDFSTEADTAVNIGGVEVPVYFLGNDELTLDLKTPPMAEELVYLDGRVYIMNESASTKYIFGNFIGGRKLYSFPAGDEQFAK